MSERIQGVKSLLTQCQNVFQRKVGEAKLLAAQAIEAGNDVTQLKRGVEVYGQVVMLFNSFGEEEQQQVKTKLEAIVSYGLEYVFNEPYKFHIEMSQTRKQVSMEFKVENSQGYVSDIYGAKGGGLVDVVGFLMQAVLIVLLKGRVRQFLVMDEALIHVSDGYKARMAEFIREIVDKTGLQILFITHNPEYAVEADVVYRFSSYQDVTTVENITNANNSQ